MYASTYGKITIILWVSIKHTEKRKKKENTSALLLNTKLLSSISTEHRNRHSSGFLLLQWLIDQPNSWVSHALSSTAPIISMSTPVGFCDAISSKTFMYSTQVNERS